MFKNLAISFLFLLLLVSCQQNTAENNEKKIDPNKTVMAKVDDAPIYKEDLGDSTLASAIKDEIFYQEGLKLELDKKYEKNFRDFKRSLIINQVKSKAVIEYLKKNQLSEQELKEIVLTKKDEYTYLKLERAAAESKEIADKLLARAIELKSLKDAAAEFRDKVQFTENAISKSKNQHFEELKKGNLSEIVEEIRKFVIYQIDDIQETPDEDVLMREKSKIDAERKQKAIAEHFEALKKEHKIEVIRE